MMVMVTKIGFSNLETLNIMGARNKSSVQIFESLGEETLHIRMTRTFYLILVFYI